MRCKSKAIPTNFTLILLPLLMGQVLRVMSYDRAANERNAIPGLQLLGHTLKWHRLNDGVMGGRSETLHSFHEGAAAADVSDSDSKSTQPSAAIPTKGAALHFSGQINTSGGGFCSIRSPLPQGHIPSNTAAIKITHIGDGKTYKFLLSDGNKSTFGSREGNQYMSPSIRTFSST